MYLETAHNLITTQYFISDHQIFIRDPQIFIRDVLKFFIAQTQYFIYVYFSISELLSLDRNLGSLNENYAYPMKN